MHYAVFCDEVKVRMPVSSFGQVVGFKILSRNPFTLTETPACR
jgi:hypothetical protein